MSKPMKGFGRAGLSALATSTLVIGACVAGAGAAHADSTFQFTRVAGHDRYEVAANVANQYGTADHVILASGEQGKYADSLAANYLAGAINAPILLTQLNTTPASTLAALKASGATKITIVGGPLSVSTSQEDSLKAAGYTVDRIEGHTRYDVDAAVITAAAKTGDTAIVATGEKFPDALAAGPLAYAKNLPVGLVTLGSAPSQVLDALKASGVKNVIILGGDLSVSQETRQQITNAGLTIKAELNGGNRAAVATQLADYEIANYGFSNSKVNVATGRELSQGADALSAGPLTGKQNRPLLITAGDPTVGTSQATGQDLLNWLQTHAKTLTGTDNLLFGGTLSISDAQKALMEKAAQTVTSNQTYDVTPTAAQNTAQGKSLQYSATGLDNGTTYTVELFSCDNVTTGTNGQTTFTQTVAPTSTTDGSGQAAQGSLGNTSISVVNGSATSGNPTMVTVKPTNGTLSFTVLDQDTSSEPICVVPVLYNDSTTTGTPGALDVDKKTGAPTEQFGTGGSATFNSPAAASSTYNNVNVISVDKAAGTFTADVNGAAAGGVMTFTYTTSGSNYYYDDQSYFPLTPSQFAEYLSGRVNKGAADGTNVSGDNLYVEYNADGPSNFYLETDVPAAPTGTTAAFQPAVTGGTSPHADQVDVKWTAPSNPKVTSYNVYRAPVDSKGTVGSYTLIGNTSSGAAAGFTGVAPANATDTEYIDRDVTQGSTYSYVVSAITSTEGPVSNAAQATDPAPSTPAATAPKIVAVTITPTNGATAGTATITYDEAVNCLAGAGKDFSYSNTAGTGTVTGATCAPAPAGNYNGSTTDNSAKTVVVTFPTTTGGTTPTAITVEAPATGDTLSYTAPAMETTANSVYAGTVTSPAYEDNQTVTDNGSAASPLQ